MNRKQSTEYVNALTFDIKAEYLVFCLLEQGVSISDVLMASDGDLKRKWSTDINSAGVESFENGDETVTIHLNRSGIYDHLPEALFHDYPDKRNASGEDMARDSTKLKAEEKQLRQFFKPFENELFFYKVRVTGREHTTLEALNFSFINGLIPGFWKFDEQVPLKYREKLIKLLPLVHQITGNYRLTAKCLAKIISEQVHIEYLPGVSDKDTKGKEIDRAPSKPRLGQNFVLRGEPTGWFGKMLIKIGPLKNSRISDFFNEGELNRLINCFIGFFIPVELDVETRILVDKQAACFTLTPAGEAGNAFLGFNTVLQ